MGVENQRIRINGRVRPGAHWRQQFMCPTIHVWKPSSFFGASAYQVGCDFHLVGASELSFVFYSLVLRQGLCWGKGNRAAYLTTHNSSDRCRENYEISLVMAKEQGLRLLRSQLHIAKSHQLLL
ncbi:hypothetical protein PoB_004814200 [Plakobranchus ocellatus]|uniref:Uncharacterized protein n=1 Tax=Plakobranchus ocellatus TaxID=259542 RepID=A0AAV4BQJ5_9GAST|nr:hypothetical protein PoB_004814200 [Plakobranchus ocellatus]